MAYATFGTLSANRDNAVLFPSRALLGLMAGRIVDDGALTAGARDLARAQAEDGFLRYHGNSTFFPMWAMAHYRNLKIGNRHQVLAGMQPDLR